ncbi:malonate decarboxylase subunit epsilon [Acinetobacter albensis]|uniref:Malonyl CoA-acyl carrier protein transacylase n=1 Tax=Acinetobacter albensis TaxID=1673609 RepID=A0A1C4GYJ0_9GAMM|nr:malonate decarboxylase subunit epsilon [Acinetobacter albensis]SCC73198.1 malonate decarboxylase epsilon subunit [Acinetobacter albensis]
MSTMWVYPGQGAQKVNMLHDLPEHPLVRHYLDRASVALQHDVLTLDQPEALRSTEAVQLCLYLAGYISSSILLDEQVQPEYVAGLSIGAWTAAAVAGVYSFEQGLQLVSLRGRLMQEAYPAGYGMTAIMNADKSQVKRWVAEVYQQIGKVYLANINAANQIVISGSEQAMQQVVDIAKNQGATAKKLNVSVPSHCELLDEQAELLVQAMENIPLNSAKFKYLSGTSARLIHASEKIKHDLIFNMCRTIDWESTVQAAWERGVRLQIEVLPGSVLTGLTRKVFKEGSVLSFQTTRRDSLIVAMRQQALIAG